ncbi:hypothetical protein DRO69_14580 [Candidatus Bathyarchaeota archaeon]|nr:MAG: hypothetical protein DRO69_14580 [Candidatus Bathyarchaeota archaeon]
MSTVIEEEVYKEEEEETRPLNAEEVTLIATEFLRRLGNRRGLKPIKASLQGEKYIVEVGLKKKTATVEIDAMNEEILQYEIKTIAEETPSFFPLTRKNILLICGIVAMSVFASSLLGIQSFIGSIF